MQVRGQLVNQQQEAHAQQESYGGGQTDQRPLSSTISIDGISSDHTDAATITPEAKPSNVFYSLTDISFFMKNTKAEPSIVPSSGISSPMINVVISY